MNAKRQEQFKLPESPGVYIMKNAAGGILYVGKAANLRRRVASYFQRVHDLRLEKLVSEIKKIDYKKTDTALEALILEAELIKKYRPPFNVREKDDKSFLYIEITKEKFPRVLLARGKDVKNHKLKIASQYGPFASASDIREAMKILRKIFPWSVHNEKTGGGKKRTAERACFDYEIGLCPGTCIGAISRKDYLKTIANLSLFLSGKKRMVLKNLEKEMAVASKKLEFEKAAKIRRRVFALRHIRDTALIFDDRRPMTNNQRQKRIEGYDISNISGTSAVGSMVVFENGEPDKNEYRKFRIRTITQANDVGMLKEVLRRRFRNNWPLPDLILVDGGAGQVGATKAALAEAGLKIPVVGIAKGPGRKRNDFIGKIPENMDKNILMRVRNEAHRFAVAYHRKLRSRASIY